MHEIASQTIPSWHLFLVSSSHTLRLARADLVGAMEGRGQPKKVPLPPPEYFGDNATHLAANRNQFTKRKMHSACFACLNRVNTKVQYNQT